MLARPHTLHPPPFTHHASPPRLIFAIIRWEIANQLEKLWLVGFMTVIANDTLVQLGIAMAVSLTFMLISSIAAPFRRKEDTYFAVACHFSLTATFFFCAMLKVKVLVNEVDAYLTPQLRVRFDFDEVLLSSTYSGSTYYGYAYYLMAMLTVVLPTTALPWRYGSTM